MFKRFDLEDINGSIDDKSVLEEAREAIEEICHRLHEQVYGDKGSVTIKIDLKRIKGKDVVVEAAGSVKSVMPARIRGATLLFPGDDGQVRTQGFQTDIEGVISFGQGSRE